MMPLTITAPLSVLVVGGGRAASIKAQTALRYGQSVTLVAPEFDAVCQGLDCRRQEGDLYQWQLADFAPFNLIYLALPWPQDPLRQQWLSRLCGELITAGKWLCVSCRPALGNVVNPCSRQVGDYLLALSGPGHDPIQTRTHTTRLARQLEQHLEQPVL